MNYTALEKAVMRKTFGIQLALPCVRALPRELVWILGDRRKASIQEEMGIDKDGQATAGGNRAAHEGSPGLWLGSRAHLSQPSVPSTSNAASPTYKEKGDSERQCLKKVQDSVGQEQGPLGKQSGIGQHGSVSKASAA